MKPQVPRKRLKLIQAMQSPLGKLQAAQGQFPEARFVDSEDLRKKMAEALFGFNLVQRGERLPAGHKERCETRLLEFGRRCAEALVSGNEAPFVLWTEFIRARRKHRPQADPIREQLLALAMDGNAINLDSLRSRLSAHGVDVSDPNITRNIYRAADDLGLRLFGKIGAPKKSDMKAGKKSRSRHFS
jgi:hypothetical protein